jgi:5'-nucleotidase
MQKVPSILVCNDDGITAPGIKALATVAREFGHVTVVAPDSAQSGMGHAITIGEPLRMVQEEYASGHHGWACSGTPADCVKLATGVLLPEKPDLLISGINHGANYSISVVYSGTLSAAMEGAIEGIPSIGFSLCDFDYHADFSASMEIVRVIIGRALHASMPYGTLLNVNIPKLPLAEIKGIRITRQSIGRWIEQFDERLDPYGRKYYWLTGKFQHDDEGQDTDIWALNNGYVSVCPVEFDFTAHHAIAALNQWNLQLR